MSDIVKKFSIEEIEKLLGAGKLCPGCGGELLPCSKISFICEGRPCLLSGHGMTKSSWDNIWAMTIIRQLLDERAAYRKVAAKRIFEDLQNSEYAIRNQKQADVLMKESLAIADAEARKLIEEGK